MAVVQEYRSNECTVLGLAVGAVPTDRFDELHGHMKRKLAESKVAYLGAPPAPLAAALPPTFAAPGIINDAFARICDVSGLESVFVLAASEQVHHFYCS